MNSSGPNKILISTILLFYSPKTTSLARTVSIEKYEACPDATSEFLLTPGEILRNGDQKVKIELKLPEDFGGNVRSRLSIFTERDDENWKQVFKYEDKKDGCEFFNKFVGSPWHEVQEHIKMTPKSCPIRKVPGNYSGEDILINFSSIQAARLLPSGRIKVTVECLDKNSNRIVLCPTYIIKVA